MEPRRPKHKQQPPLVVARDELEEALRHPETYHYALTTTTTYDRDGNDVVTPMDSVFPPPLRKNTIVEVIHTHLSMVFLLPNRVYKVKKQVNFGFVDFSTLYKRFQACYAEVQLNQRLAPSIYIGVVPVSMHRETREIRVRCDDFWTPEKNNNLGYWVNDEFGEIIEWVVHMVRLSDDHSLQYHIEQGLLTTETMSIVANRLVEFHENARRSPKIDEFGEEQVIRMNIDQNFTQTASHVEEIISASVYQRIKALTYTHLAELHDTIASRKNHGFTCDSHGDLRLEHVFLLEQDKTVMLPSSPRRTSPPKRLVIIDCIEFNENFRFGDPLSDVAFLMMDIWRMGRPDLARFLQRAYLVQAMQDTKENAQLFVFYAAYRAVVRAKICGFRVMDASLSDEHHESERQRARCYWLVALSLLSPPAERPCMLLVGGLPASGKSNLASMLVGENSSVVWLRADAIRKELMAKRDQESEETTREHGGSFEEGIYSASATQRTYDEILIRSVSHLRAGERVVVDATFRDPVHRQRFIETAHDEGALFAFILCECNREIVKGRLLARRNDVSDATWEVYERMEAEWDSTEVENMDECCIVNTEKEKELTLRRTKAFLRKIELL